jgi:hypothetical protein
MTEDERRDDYRHRNFVTNDIAEEMLDIMLRTKATGNSVEAYF